jgi:hypothetical protein
VYLIGFFGMSFGQITAQTTIPSNLAIGYAIQGGLGGKIVRVTTLDATGPGSISDAIRTKGPVIVVFEVGMNGFHNYNGHAHYS